MFSIKQLFGIQNRISHRKKENDQFVRIFIEENSYKTLRKDKEITCKEICDRYMHTFPIQNKKSEFRIVLIVKKKMSRNQFKIINKRILNGFERIFDGSFTLKLRGLTRQYMMVDVQEYLLRQHYLPVQIKPQEKALIDERIEREGLLEMRNIEEKEFSKKQFILTPELLIYHEPKNKGK